MHACFLCVCVCDKYHPTGNHDHQYCNQGSTLSQPQVQSQSALKLEIIKAAMMRRSPLLRMATTWTILVLGLSQHCNVDAFSVSQIPFRTTTEMTTQRTTTGSTVRTTIGTQRVGQQQPLHTLLRQQGQTFVPTGSSRIPGTGRVATELYVRRLFSSLSNGDSRTDNDESQDDSEPTKLTLSVSSPDMVHSNGESEQGLLESSSLQLNNEVSRRERMKERMTTLANRMLLRPMSRAVPVPRAIAEILKDATIGAVDMAVEEVMARRNYDESMSTTNGPTMDPNSSSNRMDKNNNNNDKSAANQEVNVADLINEAFAPVEESLVEMEQSLLTARSALAEAKIQATGAIEAVQAVAIAQAQGAAVAMAAAEEAAHNRASYNETEVSELRYDDVDYHLSEMSPPFLNEDQCLVPGEAVVRVEKAPENSRRIFAGIDIPVSVDTVWDVLTKYDKLQDVVPNLVVNEVLKEYEGKPKDQITVDSSLPPEQQCEQMANQLKGSLLKQIGGAKVVGINFSARTTLEVREWPNGMPDFAHFREDVFEGKRRDERARDAARVKLQRYCFPRPFALSRLPTRDISMQSIANDDGEFRLYQGVWRMQPLPGCAPAGQEAMRLTYAVEVSPRAYLPVSIVEGRIVRDLCSNLVAIRDFVTSEVPAKV